MIGFLIISTFLSIGLTTIKPHFERNDTQLFDLTDTTDLNEYRKNKDLGTCACDVTDQCDENCCCDPDCPSGVVFTQCLDEAPGISESQRKALRKCSDPEIPGDGTLLDWIQRTMLCVSRNNNPSPGKYYEIKSKSIDDHQYVENESSFSNLFNQADAEETLKPLITEIKITFNSEDADDDDYQEIQDCFNSSKILYLEPRSIKCNNEKNESISYNLTIKSYENSTIRDINCTKLDDDTEINVTSINIIWKGYDDAEPSPRGYLFGEPVLNESKYPIDIPSGPNFTETTKILFGAALDYTVSIDDISPYITNGNLTINETTQYLGFRFTTFRQIPIERSNDSISKNVTFYPYEINVDEIGINQNISSIIKLIDIYYQTIGNTQNPQHVIMDIIVNYSHTTSYLLPPLSLYPYYKNGNKTTLRTIARYFVYPNDQNMFKEVSANSKLQAWLPF